MRIIIITLLLAVSLVACNKDKRAENKLVGSWELKEYKLNGEVKDQTGISQVITFYENTYDNAFDGSSEYTYPYGDQLYPAKIEYDVNGYTYVEYLYYKTSEKGKVLELLFGSKDYGEELVPASSDIVKLNQNTLKISQSSGDDTIEITFKKL